MARVVKKALIKLWYAAKFSIAPSLTAAAILLAGTIATTQYADFSKYILNFWKNPYFLEPEILKNTISWALKVIALGCFVSIFILLHARSQEVALEKFREIDNH